jgi:hypothetical protein
VLAGTLPAPAPEANVAVLAETAGAVNAPKAAEPPKTPKPANKAVLFEAPANFAIPNAAVPKRPAPANKGNPNIINKFLSNY